ncbi:MAG: amidohydrolase family protein [Acidobacteria bacterium]|nr:amidohydrolase family protein [Acidobacteriota bacterium]
MPGLQLAQDLHSLIRKSGELGMIWSMDIGMFSGSRGEAVEITYGKEVIDRMLSPVKSLLDAGALVSFEGGNSIESFATFVTRRTQSQGNPAYVRGAREAVSRLTALRIMTLNGAKYVLKEDVLGSIEPGKWADLVVLDRNPLDPALSDDDLYNIQVLQTIVEGELIWDRERDGVPQSTGWQGGN